MNVDKKRIIRILRVVMPLVALVCIVTLPPWAGIKAWLSPLPDSVQQQVDDAVHDGLDGVIVYVDQGGRAPRLYAAGWKDAAHRVPADPHALFKIASISKLYIAAATVKLVHRHVLSLDDTLAQRLPELAGHIANADRITLRMLLQHRSGIPNFVDADGFDWARRQADSNDNLKLVLDKPADFAPGERRRYSNTNYLLIGAILDRALGYSHQRYIQQELLKPLGLNHTYGSLRDVNPADLASGHQHGIDADLKTLDFETPGGSMVATARDVGVFVRALNDGSLFDPEERALYASVYEYGHAGWLPGYHSIARYHRDIDTVVVEFVSTTGGDRELLTNVVYKRIVRILRRQAHAKMDPMPAPSA
ncbi:serine hydrolase domain-containing protein [Oleiagrimonas sp. C23AA]|uniref:serine hydrolase domain-containing protein n=1 Tax=Oleiagrimonas sp. C23AA TaxID=2719047 RepID=UPI001420BB27|nr:serine hydrolase domain-containing protein [Oleiagrimonas sp. C23AA]NII09502.1 beta-lactamase family protein [Oleiagrimonas sp. C23AA]